VLDETVIVISADHGENLGELNIYGDHQMADVITTHVPLIIRWPEQLKPGSVSDELVAFVDYAPTLLSLAGVEIPFHLQGQAFLGAKKASPREYIYAARDRMDETLDIIRAVRDKRWKYIRNYRPDLPYAQHIAYMDEMPTLKEWRRLAAEGKLAGPQTIFFAPTKPVEELYDTVADPHEIHNLAGEAQHAATLARLRAAHETWRDATGDLGLIPEADLMEMRRPRGEWATTLDPEISLGGGRATITCLTDAASIAYRIGQPPAGRWLLYSGPVPVQAGESIEAKACRLGYKDSRAVTVRAE